MFEAFVTMLIFTVVLTMGYALGYSKAIEDEKVNEQKQNRKVKYKVKYDDPGVGWPTTDDLLKARKQYPAHRQCTG